MQLGIIINPRYKVGLEIKEIFRKSISTSEYILTFWSSRPTCYNNHFDFCQSKYLKFESSGCKDKGIRKLESAASIQFFS